MPDTLLPPNATALERALEKVTTRIGDVPTPARIAKNPAAAPEALLPWLAWEYNVDEWDDTWTQSQKRAAIQQSVAVHRTKGTIGAIRAAVGALGFDIQVREWFNQVPKGQPYTFNLLLELSGTGLDQAGIQKILSVVRSAKNLRSHLGEIVPTATARPTLYTACAGVSGLEITVGYGGVQYIERNSFARQGGGYFLRQDGTKYNIGNS